MKARTPRRAVHGVLLLDKPYGMSSNMALQVAKRLFRAEKAGHTGTLDPLATGLLPLCFGAATKLSQVALDADKRYLATLQLGETTTTADAEGEVVMRRAVDVDRERFEAVCAGFVGSLSQRPPMHSALKHEGKPLYEYARAGVDVERASRSVVIDAIDLVGDIGDAGEGGGGDRQGQADRWTIDVSCSKGTYVRTLAADIGEALGCGAHLSALRRTACGALSLADAVTIEQIEAASEAGRDGLLMPADALVAGWPAVALDAPDAALFLTGMRRRVGHRDAARVRVYGPDPDAFLGIAHIVAGELIATRLLSPAEIGRTPTLGTQPVDRPITELEKLTP